MLELNPKKEEKSIETDKYPVVKTLLEHAWIKPKLGGLLNLTHASIDENRVILELRFGEDSGTINPQLFNKKNEPYFFPFFHSYSSSEKNKGTLEFQLNPGIGYMSAIFAINGRFHRTIDEIFGTEDVTEGKFPKYTHTRIGRLEQKGLEGAENLEIELTYKTPFAVWRALPLEFTKNVQGFSFNNLTWPKQTSSYNVMRELGVRGFNLNRDNDKREQIKEALKKTGLVEYTLKEGRTSSDNEHSFLVKPEEIRAYESLQRLENIARELDPDGKNSGLRGWESEVLVQGNLPRDAFASVVKMFDSEEIRIEGYVKGGNIKVKREEVLLNKASLEKISRLIQTGALNHCSLKLSLETDKWRTIDFCKDTGYNQFYTQ